MPTMPDTSVRGNTIPNAKKNYCFTLFNYSEEELCQICQVFKSNSIKYVIGREECPTTKKKHLQGFIHSPKKIYLTGLKKLIGRNDVHIEACKGNELQNINYCIKGNDYVYYEFEIPKKKKEIKILDESKFYYYQRELLKIILSEPDDRTIYWLYEEKGNTGKSTFSKYLGFKHNAVILSGNKSDMLYTSATYETDLYIVDISRSEKNKLNYESLESIKNGFYNSPKYESKPIIRNNPHIIVFSNFMPELNKLSLDRWKVHKIDLDKKIWNFMSEDELIVFDDEE